MAADPLQPPADPWCPPDGTATDDPSPALEELPPGEVTLWLQRMGGETPPPAVAQQLFTLLYDELRRLARSQLRRENPGHTLSATALAHEAWLKLALQQRVRWQSRSHFMAVCATMMRRILVGHARARRAARRDGERVSLTLSGLEALPAGPQPDVVQVHEALTGLQTVDARAAQVVELRYFGGLEIEEVAEALGLSPATVKRDWAFARAWLRRELAGA